MFSRCWIETGLRARRGPWIELGGDWQMIPSAEADHRRRRRRIRQTEYRKDWRAVALRLSQQVTLEVKQHLRAQEEQFIDLPNGGQLIECAETALLERREFPNSFAQVPLRQ